MKRRQSTEYNFWHLLLGLLLGFFLGSGLVFLNFNRQNDSISNTNNSTLDSPGSIDRSFNQRPERKAPQNIKEYSSGLSNNSMQKHSHIITDKLIQVKNIILEIEPQELSNARLTLDTIIGKVNGSAKRPESVFRIEFWESPINYRGYKKTRNKIVLYGISAINAASFEVHNNDIYMQYLNDYYHLIPTNDLKTLEPVTSDLLIDQIKYKWQ